jgi:hypothetical protein
MKLFYLILKIKLGLQEDFILVVAGYSVQIFPYSVAQLQLDIIALDKPVSA